MEKLVEQINEEILVWNTESEAAVKGNKSAARRARKSTMALTRLFKEFRSKSI